VRGVVVVLAAAVALSAQAPPKSGACTPVGRSQWLPAVPEASGLALAGGALWTHNDSDAPVLFRLDASGRTTPVTVADATVRDWEDLAAGPCAAGTCLYIADIGDNRGARERITLYEVPTPAPGEASTKPAIAIHARYPDYPHDAEALLRISGSAQLKLSPASLKLSPAFFIVTKEVPTRIYTFAAPQQPGETATLKLVRTLKEKTRITGGAVSPDERWIALRSNGALLLYTVDDFVKGGEPIRVDLRSLKEPQGEGVAFGSGGELYLVSEGGGKNAAGMLTRVHCAFVR
jgi:hypothetical protein